MIRTALLLTALFALAACDGMPGRPKSASRWKSPSEMTDFATLYRQNCLGCHGMDQEVSGSLPMDAKTYLAVLPREVLLDVISRGIPSTAMPGFSTKSGGTLTEAQIKILTDGILANKPSAPDAALPPYAAEPGDPARGATAFAAACASCHGEGGTGGEAGSVVHPAYLDLVSSQYLRTNVIAGRPDLGCPDFANRISGRRMTNEEISDVVAWVISNRKNEFGQPLVPVKSSLP